MRTGSGSRLEVSRLPLREEGLLEERFERVIGMAELLYCFLHKLLNADYVQQRYKKAVTRCPYKTGSQRRSG